MKFLRAIFLIYLASVSAFTVSATAQSVPLTVIPFILNNGHIVIQIELDGSQKLNFLFDSGAGGTLILKDVADSLGYKSLVKRKNIGVSGSHKVSVIKGVKLKVGEIKAGNITLLSTESVLEEMDDGRRIHGVIGYPILSRYVVEVDYSKSEVRLYQRNSFLYSGKGQKLPISVESNLPIAQGKVTTYNQVKFEGNFLVDTGARSDLILSAPTVVEHEMANNIGKHYTVRAMIGTSQRKSKIRYGRVKSFQIVDYRFENLPVALSSDNKGLLANPSIEGIIGNRLLQRFNVTFDYQRGVIYLEPGVFMGNDHVINSSGFDIYFVHGMPFIKNIVDRSGGDIAGLRNGDQLISINGVLVEKMSGASIRASFLGKNKKLEIVVKRNNKLKYTELMLKPLI